MGKKCPICGKEMIVRAGKFGQFYGCTGFPRCRYTTPLTPVPPANVAGGFTPSPYQAAIFEAVQNGRGHLVVEAVAGSGKTTTIVRCLALTRPDQSVAFVAFNKRIAEELKARAPRHVHVSTLHSLGYANIRQAWGAVVVDEKKVSRIVKTILETRFSPDEQERLLDQVHTIVRLVGLRKNTLSADYKQIADTYCCGDLNGEEAAIFEIAAQAFEQSNADHAIIDYDDMIYYPAVGAVACRRFDWFFVDETQDLNKAQIEFVLRSVNKSGRVVAVGDRYQSIYGFRGADVSAIPSIIAALNAETLPLSICYRCPKSHVEVAKEIVPQIEASPTAVEGRIESITVEEMCNIAGDGDMVLCRRNAPLVGHAFALIRQGKKAVILGQEIATDLVALTRKLVKKCGDKPTVSRVISALTAYRAEAVARLRAAEKEAQADQVADQCETILIISEECETPDQIESRIDQIFSDVRQGVTFATVHKAKGCEADRVFLLKPNELGYSKHARTPADMQQELNLAYVAYTRAKREMFFVNDKEESQ